jgi:hypothetical protein
MSMLIALKHSKKTVLRMKMKMKRRKTSDFILLSLEIYKYLISFIIALFRLLFERFHVRK